MAAYRDPPPPCEKCAELEAKIKELEEELARYKAPSKPVHRHQGTVANARCVYCSWTLYEPSGGNMLGLMQGVEMVPCFDKGCAPITHVHFKCRKCNCWWIEEARDPQPL